MHKALYREYRPQKFSDVVGQEHIIRTLKNEIMSGNIAHAYMFSGTRGTGKTTAAKYRPQKFSDVVGQEHIIRTLKNEIMSGNIAHAYMFSGTRGTGKTTAAKIFARAVNCLNPQNGEPCNECESCKAILNDSTVDIFEIDAASNNSVDDVREIRESCLNPQNGEPCNECESCKAILNDSTVDIFEIDAASNNSVDDVREIRESVKYTPANSKYKVYIIDEAHMLSKGASNALLKTIEEPPEYVVFIFATTEPNKMIPTVLSRCQRFDFKRITVEEIKDIMRNICSKEVVESEEEEVLSRCQRFDFKRITVEEMKDRMRYICSKEGVEAEEDALSKMSEI